MAAAAIALTLVATVGIGQPYPARPVTIIVPDARFRLADISARLVALKLTDVLGQPVLVENRIGAGGATAPAAAKAAPDGYTLLVVPADYAAGPRLFRNLHYDSGADFAPISLLVRTPFVLAVNAGVPAKSVKELVQLAKSKPGAVTFATLGPASQTRLLMEMLRVEAGVNIAGAQYEDAAPALADLAGGMVDAMFPTVQSAVAHVASGRLRALAVTSESPAAALPGVPLMKDAFPACVAQYWVGMLAPAKTSPAIIARLNSDIAEVLRSDELKTRFGDLGLDTVGGTPDEFGQLIKGEMERWGSVMRARKSTD